MNVPRQFLLSNRTWRVKFRDMKPHGETHFDDAVIYLSTRIVGSPELIAQTFMHELLHAASSAMAWKRVNEDEERIDALAGLLVQALTTAKV